MPRALAVVWAPLWTSLGKLPEPRVAQMCDLIEPQPAEKIGKMKKLRRTLSESFSRIGEWRAAPGTGPDAPGACSSAPRFWHHQSGDHPGLV